MTDIVPIHQIENIVGVSRHVQDHWARDVSQEETIYILHSQKCLQTIPDLRTCPFSLALDAGVFPDEWPKDTPVKVQVLQDPLRLAPLDDY